MMLTQEILKRLTERGVSIKVDGDDLVLSPATDVPQDLVRVIRENKASLLLHLAHDHGREAFEPWVLWEWRRVSIPEWRHILGESVEAGDVRREGYARWMLREVLLDPEYQEDEL